MVVDADGLNTLAANPELLKLLPEGSILTPHIKEFARLFGESANHYERLEKLHTAATENDLVIVLKGAHSAIALGGWTYIFQYNRQPWYGHCR